MAIQQLGKFFEEVVGDLDLKAEINAISFEELPERLVEYGRARGYEFTADEVREMASPGSHELGLEELDAVSGGDCILSGTCVVSCPTSGGSGGPGDIIRNLHRQKVLDISSFSTATNKLTRG